MSEQKLTGGSSDYYRLEINGHVIECNDVIKGLKLNYALGNILKAVWRIGMSHKGAGKPGTTTVYDAEKIVFFGEDQLDEEKKAQVDAPETESVRYRAWDTRVPAEAYTKQEETEQS